MYQTFIEETKAKIKGRNAKDSSQNMYRLDGKVREMVASWDQWRNNDALTSEEIRTKLEQIRVELDTEIATFREEWERRMEQERRAREEEERRRREEQKRREEEEQKRQREERIKSMIQVRDRCRQLFDVSCWFSDTDLQTLYQSLQDMWDPPIFESWIGSRTRSPTKSSSSLPTSTPCSTPCTSISTFLSRHSPKTSGLQDYGYSRGDSGYQWGAGISSLFHRKSKDKAKAKRTQPLPPGGEVVLSAMHEAQGNLLEVSGESNGDWGHIMSPYHESSWDYLNRAASTDAYALISTKESLASAYSNRGSASSYSSFNRFSSYQAPLLTRRGTSVSTFLPVGGYEREFPALRAEYSDPYNSRGDSGAYEAAEAAETAQAVQDILSSLWFMLPRECAPQSAPLLRTERCETTIRLSPAASYTGEVLLGVPDGQGKLVDVTAGKLVYAGAWREGKFHGRGTRYAGELELESGEWEAGRFVRGRRVRADGAVEIGTFVNGALEGEGRVVFPSLAAVSGVWQQGRPVGRMRYALPGWEEFEYDEAEAEKEVKRRVVVNENYIYFRTTEVKGAIPDFLFYSNGDIFVGETQMRTRPHRGLFFHMMKRGYCRMEMNGGYPGMEIHDITVLVTENNKLKKVLFC